MPAERLRSITENRIERKEAGIGLPGRLAGRLLREEWRGDQQREKNYGHSSDSIHVLFPLSCQRLCRERAPCSSTADLRAANLFRVSRAKTIARTGLSIGDSRRRTASPHPAGTRPSKSSPTPAGASSPESGRIIHSLELESGLSVRRSFFLAPFFAPPIVSSALGAHAASRALPGLNSTPAPSVLHLLRRFNPQHRQRLLQFSPRNLSDHQQYSLSPGVRLFQDVESLVLIERVELIGKLKGVFRHVRRLEGIRRQLRHIIQPRGEIGQRPEIGARLTGKISCHFFGGELIEVLARIFRRSPEFSEDIARAADGVLQVRAGLASELQSIFKIES